MQSECITSVGHDKSKKTESKVSFNYSLCFHTGYLVKVHFLGILVGSL